MPNRQSNAELGQDTAQRIGLHDPHLHELASHTVQSHTGLLPLGLDGYGFDVWLLSCHPYRLSAGAFNTREFFHGARPALVRRTRQLFQLFAFAIPLLLVGLASTHGFAWAWLLAVPVQFAGLLAERWFFFAQARHPQNLYYQFVS